MEGTAPSLSIIEDIGKKEDNEQKSESASQPAESSGSSELDEEEEEEEEEAAESESSDYGDSSQGASKNASIDALIERAKTIPEISPSQIASYFKPYEIDNMCRYFSLENGDNEGLTKSLISAVSTAGSPEILDPSQSKIILTIPHQITSIEAPKVAQSEHMISDSSESHEATSIGSSSPQTPVLDSFTASLNAKSNEIISRLSNISKRISLTQKRTIGLSESLDALEGNSKM